MAKVYFNQADLQRMARKPGYSPAPETEKPKKRPQTLPANPGGKQKRDANGHFTGQTEESPAEILRKEVAKQKREVLEDQFAYCWSIATDGDAKLKPQRQFQFHEKRKFRFDFAWPAVKLAVEINGGQWINGGHNRGGGMNNDCDKKRLAIEADWRVMEFTGDDISKRPCQCVEQVLNALKKLVAK